MKTVTKWWICALWAVLMFSSGCDDLDLKCDPGKDSACTGKAREFKSLTSGGARISSDNYRMDLFIAPIHPVGTVSSTNYTIKYGPGAIRSTP